MLITKESFKGTIERDPCSCYWFLKFLFISPVDNHSLLPDYPTNEIKRLRTIYFLQKTLYFLCIPLVLGLSIVFRQPPLLLAIITITLLLYLLEHLKIRQVVKAAWWLVRKEFSKEIMDNMTYFQLTEQLGNKYGIPTLVDTIARWDWTLRRWILIIYVVGTMILFLNPTQFIAMFAIAFGLLILFLRYAS